MRCVDIVIVSDSKTKQLKEMTEYTLDTLYKSENENDVIFYTYIVETSNVDFSKLHKNIKMVKPNTPFGYHKYLNIGRINGNSEFVCLCNNDLEFHKNWASNIIKCMDDDSTLLSASPISNYPQIDKLNITINSGNYYGHKLWYNVSGWCIFQKREIYNIIGDLDENFIFWFCDNDYAEDLKHKNINHALITSSYVNHLVSKTLNTHDSKLKDELTFKQEQIFNKKWKK